MARLTEKHAPRELAGVTHISLVELRKSKNALPHASASARPQMTGHEL
jgi:hypothetical protein